MIENNIACLKHLVHSYSGQMVVMCQNIRVLDLTCSDSTILFNKYGYTSLHISDN